MELDKRVGEYAAAILRDADLLLADTSNFSNEQLQFVGQLKQSADRFQSLYNDCLAELSRSNRDIRLIVFDVKAPLSVIGGYCGLLLVSESDNLTQSQRQFLQQVESAYQFILECLQHLG